MLSTLLYIALALAVVARPTTRPPYAVDRTTQLNRSASFITGRIHLEVHNSTTQETHRYHLTSLASKSYSASILESNPTASVLVTLPIGGCNSMIPLQDSKGDFITLTKDQEGGSTGSLTASSINHSEPAQKFSIDCNTGIISTMNFPSRASTVFKVAKTGTNSSPSVVYHTREESSDLHVVMRFVPVSAKKTLPRERVL